MYLTTQIFSSTKPQFYFPPFRVDSSVSDLPSASSAPKTVQDPTPVARELRARTRQRIFPRNLSLRQTPLLSHSFQIRDLDGTSLRDAVADVLDCNIFLVNLTLVVRGEQRRLEGGSAAGAASQFMHSSLHV
jgi:hypothetical protein